MTTTKDDIRRWLNSSKEKGYSHVLIVCDTFEHDDYPVEFNANNKDEIKEIVDKYSENMQKPMELYNLSIGIEEQLIPHRVWNE